jgi:hypothetical protein
MIDSKRCILTVLDIYEHKIPQVLEDYIYSLGIVDEIIHISELHHHLTNHADTVYIITQMILTKEFLQDNNNATILKSDRITFLNVEMLTESLRMQRMVDIITHTNFKIADYSAENIHILITYCFQNNVQIYNHDIIYLPYQFNLKENMSLKNLDGEYTHDIGIINALPSKSDTVDESLTYRRSHIWETLQNNHPDMKIINILGWGEERDELIKRCKIILNVHHFECFNIHESIRCDRLVFANKIIVTDTSHLSGILDTTKFMYATKYDNLIEVCKTILANHKTFVDINKTNHKYLHNVIANRKIVLDSQCKKIIRPKYHKREQIFNTIITNNTFSYLEIGIENGCTFSAVNTTNKTGVDPSPKCDLPNIVKVTSDEFFASNTRLFDIIFIDGMHQLEYIRRDFNNAVTVLNNGGTIFLDDIYPLSDEEQWKIPKHHMLEDGILKYTSDPWTGDGWKLMYYLLLVHSRDIHWEVYTSPGYRGVVKMQLNSRVHVGEDKLDQMNNYTYASDFLKYIQIIQGTLK